MPSVKLSVIREIQSKDALKEALKAFLAVRAKLTLGEEHAITRTIQATASRLGINNNTLNQWTQEQQNV